MATREIVLRLRAETGQYAASLGKAAKATQGVATAAQAASRSTTNSLSGIGKAAQATGGSINALGAGAAVGMGKATNALTGVDKAATSANVSISRLGSGGLKGLSASVDSVAQKTPVIQRLSTSIRDNRDSWDELSRNAMIGGAAIMGGLGLATKAAIDWESAWAGVTKTVDGTDTQMAELEAGLRGLARELPATHAEIAGVAEAAGQLGVARGDILQFTETAIALGESTNLSADEAATSLAQFSNVMGTVAREGAAGYERLGSTLVALGNDGASTEKQIMDMSLRLAGAGQQIGATEADILAMANALSSVGIEAELGGGAMSRALLQMNSAVIGGGEELEKFAEIAGMSASEFAAKWRSDPIAATNDFVAGLGRIGDSGGDAAGALADVGLKGTQNAQVLLRAAGASDLMTDSLKLGASAWEENSALQEEATKRYETSASRMQIAQNTFKDAAIDLGSVAGPALAAVAEKAAGVADWFVKLPGPAQQAAGAIAGVAGSALLIGGATVKMVGWGQDLRDALDGIGIKSGPRADKALRGLAKAGAGLAVFAAVRVAMGSLQEIFDEAVPSADQLARAVNNLSKSGNLDELNQGIERLDVKKSSASAESISNMGDAVAFLNNQTGTDKARDWVQGLVGMDSDVDRLTQYISGLDQELTNVFEQDPARAREMWAVMVEETKAAGGSVKDLKEQFPLLVDAMENAKDTQLADSLAGTTQAAEEAEEAVDDLSDAITGLGDALLGQRGSARDYQQSLSDLKKAIGENGATLDISTQAGRDNAAALDDLAQSTQDYAAATFESTGSVEKAEGVLDRGRKQWEKYAAAAGMPQPEIEALADQLFTFPDEKVMDFKVTGTAEVAEQATSVGLMLGGIPDSKNVEMSETGSMTAAQAFGAMKSAIDLVPGSKRTEVTESGAAQSAQRVTNLTTKIRDLTGKEVTVLEAGANSSRTRVMNLDGAIFGLKGKTVKVEEIGSTASGDRVVRFKGEIYTLQGKSVDVNANVHGLWDVGALAGSIAGLQSKTVTVTAVARQVGKIGSWMHADGGIMESAGGGLHQTFADDGFAGRIGSQQPQLRPAGGRGILWAEEGAGPWEGFVSGHPHKRPRSRAITEDIASRLGGRVEWFADGGVRERTSRAYVAPQAPAQASAAVDSRAIGAAVAAQVGAEMRGWQPMVQIGDRRFFGQMQRTTANRKGR